MRAWLAYLLQVAAVSAHVASPRGTGTPQYSASHRPIPDERLFANFTQHHNQHHQDLTHHRNATHAQNTTCKRSPLRILPLGASITFGERSSDGNGYRNELKNLLEKSHFKVEMVGNVKSGKMKNNANEGHGGALVHEMNAYAKKDVSLKPDIILINVGTNDAKQNSTTKPIAKIDERMNSLLDQLFKDFKDVTIVLSTLIPNKNSAVDCNVRDVVNPKYRDIVRKRRAKKQRIVLADMYDKVGMGGLSDDGTHPQDKGYKSMAQVWHKSVVGAKKWFC